MLIGRKKELSFLNELYNSDKFEFLILHGRRRIGKSYLLTNFIKDKKNSIYYVADKSNEENNVKLFVKELKKIYNFLYLDNFSSWYEVFDFLNNIEIKERLTIIIDEFSYLLFKDDAFDSKLQNAIDNILKNKNIFLILCGSEVGTIINLINDSSKPLYGRKTAELELKSLNYLEAREFFPKYNNLDALKAYLILGGTPMYLSLFNDTLSLKENIIRNIISNTGFLFNEVENLLRTEFKEITLYYNILKIINYKKLNLNDIASKVYEDNAKVAKYLNILIKINLVNKFIPVGEKENKRNALYGIVDNYFSFYFTFIAPNLNVLNGLMSSNAFYDNYLNVNELNNFFGPRYELICHDFIKMAIYNKELPQIKMLGYWWGKINNIATEIDILGLNDNLAIIGECKFRNKNYNDVDFKKLVDSTNFIKKKNKIYLIFNISNISINNKNNIICINLDKLYKKSSL